MPHLELRFLGPFQAACDGAPITAFESDKVRALLATLVVDADRAHPRDALAALLWPDRPDASARKNLRQALTNLRHAIADERADPPFLSITRDSLQFNAASDHRLDVAEFDRLLTSAKAHRHRRLAGCTPCLESLRQAVALYRGDFLVAFHPGDCPAFEEWALLRREALRRRALDALYDLTAAHLQRGEFDAARQYAHRQLELDAWREEAHRQVMIALAATGQRSAALAQFEQCRNVLQAELGVEPDEATLALHDQNRANTPRQLRRRRRRASSPSRAADAAAPTPEDPI
ncbi:MAG: BTAD domain-containing putative transcriptional regulator [Anaerolineales bacterium]